MTPPAVSSARYQALIQLLRTAEDLWNASRIFFARWQLSPSQFNVLNLLHAHPDGLSQSRLSQLLIMHRSNATGLVDRLERRGLVQRQDDAHDRRAYQVVLTDPGRQLLEAIFPHYFAAADRVWAGVPEPRVEQLLEELRDLAANAAAVGGTEGAVAQIARDARRTARRTAGTTPTPPHPAPEGLFLTSPIPSVDPGADTLRISDL